MDSIKMWGLMGIEREIDSMRLKAFYIKSKAPPSSPSYPPRSATHLPSYRVP